MSLSKRPPDDTITIGRMTDAPSKYHNISTAIVELLAEVIGVDPTETQLHLEEHVSVDDLDRGLRADHEVGRETSAKFQFGDYTVECFSDGRIQVLVNSEKYANGDVELPASMHDNLGTHT